MICQSCGAYNREPASNCQRCGQKLLVVSGLGPGEADLFHGPDDGSRHSFDEHLLERISSLEESLERTSRTVRDLLDLLDRQERTILINQAGVATARELLERRDLAAGEEWDELWQQRTRGQLIALEKRQRFADLAARLRLQYDGARRPEFEARLDDAEFALHAYDLQRAIVALEAAVELSPDASELTSFLGEVLFNEGRGERALECFEQALEHDPEQFQAVVYGGILRHEMGEPEAAAELLESAVERFPDAFLARLGLGAVYTTLGRNIEARRQFERAVEIDPVPQALFLLGSNLYEGGKLGAAIERLEETVRLDPALEEAHHVLGLVYLDRGWNRKALGAFRRAEELNPRRLHYQQMVRFLSGNGRDPLPAVEGDAGKELDRSERLAEEGRLEEALVALEAALEIEEEHPTLWLAYGRRALGAGHLDAAEKAARRALALAEEEMLRVTAAATLLEILRAAGKLEEGRLLAEELAAQMATDFGRTVIWCELAWSLAELEEELDRALSYASRAAERAPEELAPFPLAALGWVHYKRRDYAAAVEALARSSELGPSADTLTHLGLALAADGRREEAQRVLEQARRSAEGEPSLQQRMMECVRDTSRLFERVNHPVGTRRAG